jgi:hypothetical protein
MFGLSCCYCRMIGERVRAHSPVPVDELLAAFDGVPPGLIIAAGTCPVGHVGVGTHGRTE